LHVIGSAPYDQGRNIQRYLASDVTRLFESWAHDALSQRRIEGSPRQKAIVVEVFPKGSSVKNVRWKIITRRDFLAGLGAASIGVSLPAAEMSRPAQSAVVLLADEVGVVRPELHGQFIEQRGTCVYGGLWVGLDSSVPNIYGYRKAAVEYLQKIQVPVMRWPGGCFAEIYHWEYGIGSAKRRRSFMTKFGHSEVESSQFGTHEFIGLCRLFGAQPYVAGNVGSGTPAELKNWMEYCNYQRPTTLTKEREANGDAQPFGVKYWGVGNEAWGCGGYMSSEEYAREYLRFANLTEGFDDPKPFLIACGPLENDTAWTRTFMDVSTPYRPNGLSMHYYCRGRSGDMTYDGPSAEAQFREFAGFEAAIITQRSLMDSYPMGSKVGLVVDEWGVWDRLTQKQQDDHGNLWQQVTMRSAVAAALGLNIFTRQADKLVMCNIAQTVNILHALIFAEHDQCVRTSTYYVFEMMKVHRGGIAVRVISDTASDLPVSIAATKKEWDAGDDVRQSAGW
jgi:alpha-N-arabinofuranosidase